MTERDVAWVASQPITLSTFRSKNTTHVFAASDRPTVIYSSNKKVLYSNVNLREVSHMCPFNSAAFPDSLAISVENNLTIGTIDDIQKLHIRTVKLNEFPRRIVHQEETRTFAILTVTLVMDQGFVRLLDAQTFEVIACHSTTPNGLRHHRVYAWSKSLFRLTRDVDHHGGWAVCCFAGDGHAHAAVNRDPDFHHLMQLRRRPQRLLLRTSPRPSQLGNSRDSIARFTTQYYAQCVCEEHTGKVQQQPPARSLTV
jgi:hypothetical protein